MRRRKLGVKRLREIAGGYSATHDVETVPMAEEVLELRDEVKKLKADRDEWKRRAAAHGCDTEKGDPDCG
jgi:hypothetical protein